MRAKRARQLRIYGNLVNGETRKGYRRRKRAWNRVPRPQRGTISKTMDDTIADIVS